MSFLMTPEKIASGTITNFILYLSIIGVLLFVATLLRLKVPFLKKAFIPASLIAGILGLILGPYVLGVFPPEMRSSFSAMPTPFIVIVFACMMLGTKHNVSKEALIGAAPSIVQCYTYSFTQVGLTALLTGLIFTPLWGTNPMFGSVIEIGFEGGHGTAGGMTEVFQELGWAAGADVSQTTATIGLLVGIFGGIILINVAVKKNWTTLLSSSGSLSGDATEVFDDSVRKPSTYTTISGNVIDTFAFHAALIGIAILIGQIIIKLFKLAFNYSLPLFPFAMIGGWLLNMVLQRTPVAKMMDRGIFVRIQGIAMDFLIVAAVSSVSIPVVLEYWKELVISCVVVTAVVIFLMVFFGPRLYPRHWFESSITRFGIATGVAAIGLMLLRITDPDLKTDAAETYALGTPFCSPFVGGGLVTTAYPYLIVSMGSIQVGLIFIALTAAVFLVCRLIPGLWQKTPKYEQRGNL